jgi:hypothetical protein
LAWVIEIRAHWQTFKRHRLVAVPFAQFEDMIETTEAM